MKQLHRRVVVTGLGILSPIGNTLDEAWDSCINGISGITNIDIDLENNPIKVGGRLKNFNPEDFLILKKLEELSLLFNMELLLQTNLYNIQEFLILKLTYQELVLILVLALVELIR